jgi:hypothetical protein
MVCPSCTHPEPSASFAASGVKTQQPVEKLLRAHFCPRFRDRIRHFRSVLVSFSGSLGEPTGPKTTFSTG